jgi:hypothetical protein
MTADGTGWVRSWQGQRPELAWSFTTEAPLVALDFARETGEVLAADEAGGLYRLDRSGRLAAVTHGPSPIRGIGWSDTGSGGVVLVGENRLFWYDRQLTFLGHLEAPAPVTALALESHARYAAVSLDDCQNVIYDAWQRPVRRFMSLQALIALAFLSRQPGIVGVAEYDLLCAFSFEGEQQWQEKLWAGVGEMALSGNDESILLACFGHGIQCHDSSGQQVGSYQLGGTVSRVATGYLSRKIAAATFERHFYYLANDGGIEWVAELPERPVRLACEPLESAVVCGLESGRIVRLVFEDREAPRAQEHA